MSCGPEKAAKTKQGETFVKTSCGLITAAMCSSANHVAHRRMSPWRFGQKVRFVKIYFERFLVIDYNAMCDEDVV